MATVCILSAYTDDDVLGQRILEAYTAGALAGGHRVQSITIYRLHFDPFAYTYSFQRPPALEEDLKKAVAKILQSDHLAIFVPVFKAYIPTITQSFFQLLFAPDTFGKPPSRIWGESPYLHLKTARIVSTLDADSWAQFQKDRSARFHPVKKSVLEVLGFWKVRTTTIPPVYEMRAENEYLQKWLGKIRELGEKNF